LRISQARGPGESLNLQTSGLEVQVFLAPDRGAWQGRKGTRPQAEKKDLTVSCEYGIK